MITHRTELTQGIDWLQYTTARYEFPREWNGEFDSIEHGRWGYTKMRIYRDGRVVLRNPERPEMGEHVQMSAGVLERLHADYGITPWGVVEMLQEGDRVTRIDLCVDAQRGSLNMNALDRALRRRKVRTRARTAHRLRATMGTGDTLYIGDASSPKRLRIYDKAAEQKVEEFEWTRIELQVRKPFAQSVAREIATRPGDESIIPGFIQGFADFPDNRDWSRIFVGAPILMTAPKQERDGTLEWLMKTCAPALARHQVANPRQEILLEFLRVYREEYQRLINCVE